MNKFKKGDMVEILPMTDTEKSSYPPSWMSDMDNYIGKVTTVECVFGDGRYKLHNTNNWTWHDINLRELERKQPLQELANELDRLGIGYYWKDDTLTITEYVIGRPQTLAITKAGNFQLTVNDEKTIYANQEDFGDEPGELTPVYIAQQCKRFHDAVEAINQLALNSQIEFSV